MIDPSRYAIRETVITIAATTAVAVRGDPNRIALIFACNLAAAARVSTRNVIAANEGIPIPGPTGTYEVWWGKHGALVNSPWNCIGAAGSLMTVIEVYELPESKT